MRKRFKSMAAVGISLAVIAGATSTFLTGCHQPITNENTPLTLSSEALDEVFNPFFYTAGADGEIVGQTQIGMLTSDGVTGELIANWEEACVAFDYSVIKSGTRETSRINQNTGNDDGWYTDYYFPIKNNIKFSDGTLLTMDDVLFNIYMYLDLAYTGSSTMYSVDIQGLQAYRSQSTNLNEQGAFEATISNGVETRLNAIRSWIDNNKTNDWGDFDEYEAVPDDPQLQKDIEQAHSYFLEELNSDWRSMADVAKDYEKYVDRNGNRLITEQWQIFLFNYGLYTMTRYEVPNSLPDAEGNKQYYYEPGYSYDQNMAKDQATMVNYVYNYMVGDYATAPKSYKTNLSRLISLYATAGSLRSYIRADVIARELAGEMIVPNVTGITVMKNQDTIDTQTISYDSDGNEIRTNGTKVLKDANGNEGTFDVLHIRINGVDPKAIQNFAFTVAPGHYYAAGYEVSDGNGGTVDVWEKAKSDPEYFGVPFSDSKFMDHIRFNQVPLGAGPYRATTMNGSSATQKIAKGDFSRDGIVYFERNDNFLLGAPKIRLLNYKVISNTALNNAVPTGEVHFASPQAKHDTITDIQNNSSLSYVTSTNLGYGYIGISATYIHNIDIRRAIMTTLSPEYCISYYGGGEYAEIIRRPMSKTLTDYYPTDAEAYYEYDPTGEKALDYLYAAGCEPGTDGKMREDHGRGDVLKYTFTIAGDSEDHPATSLLRNSARILNNIGMEITVTTDSTALSKLANGQLTVWAAAWSSSSDPDMYQVYHKNSSATSIKAWGYPYLLSNECDSAQRQLVNDLSDLIEAGREYTEVSERKPIYEEALDKLMELAVEFPTYQRKLLYVWPKGLFDESTIYGTNDQVGPYRSPLSHIWNVSFNETA